MAGQRVSETSIRANTRKLSPDLRKARNKWKKFGRGVEKDLKGSFGGVRRSIGQIAGFAGVAGFAALGRDVLGFEKKLTRLSIQAKGSGVDFGKFRSAITEASNATGQSRNNLIDAASKFVSLTGDAKTAEAAIGLFGRVATATGASLEDVAATAASLTKNLGITEVDKMEEAFSAMTAQGKAGAIEIRELSTLMSGLTPQFVLFEDKGVKALRSMGANLQLIRNNFGTAEEAATGLRGLMTSIIKNSKRFKGVEIFTTGPGGVRNLKQFDEIIRSISNSRLAKDPEALAKAFGRVEALRAFLALTGESAEKIEELIQKAKDANVISDDFATFQASAAGKIAVAWERIKNTFANILTPQRIESLANAFEKLADGVAFLVDNMGIFLGVAIAGKFAKFAFQLNAMIPATAALGGKIGAMTGFLSKAGIAASVFVAAYALGTAIDQTLGLSDAISDALVKVNKLKDATGLLRGETEKFGFIRRATFGAGRELTEEEKTAARFAVREAEDKGIIGPTGKINEAAVRKLQEAAATSLEDFRQLPEATEEFIAALRFAQESVRRQGGGTRAPTGATPKESGRALAPGEVVISGEIEFDVGTITIMNDKKNRRARP
ncbi:hypothetical protein LCGC14_1295810 [marine sediment metagenome]|uniref:Phage tail tape measure protein domain-containing protein n=1 Tax=marine sediment metagenome TaxID=412755 RepID=A0A0F9KRD9_9ZZZZ